MNADKIKFRASSMGYLMTEPREKAAKEKGELSETAKTHLIDVFVSAKYGRNTDIANKYTTKGLMVEEDSLTLYSMYKNQYYTKNQDRIENEWISGCPDIITPGLIDIKSSWDIYTFFRVHGKELNKRYFWQLQAYMDLTGLQSSTLAYCLVNTPAPLIWDEKRRLQFRMNAIDDATDDVLKAFAEIDKNCTYDDISLQEKVLEIEVKRDDEAIERMHKTVERARIYMNKELFKSVKEEVAA